MGIENEDGQQNQKQEQKQEEIRIVKTETLEQMPEQTLEQGKLSQSLTYSAPAGPQPEEKEAAAEKLRRAFAEKIKEQDALLQKKRDLRSQYENLLNQYRDDSGEQYDDISFMNQEDQIVLTNIKKQLKDLEKQESNWETEIYNYIIQGPEYERDYLLAQLEWAKQDQKISEEKAVESRMQISQLYQERIQANAEKQEAELKKKPEMKPQEGLRDASVRQKQAYLNHLGQYRQARKKLAELAKGKKFKALKGYLAEFDRYTNEEDVLYSRVRERLFDRIRGEAQKLLTPDKPEDAPAEDVTETLLECLTEAQAYTEAVHQYGETMNLIQEVLEEEETDQLIVPYHGEMVRNARIQVALEAVEKEKTIFSSSEFKRIADRLKAYQSALLREGADSPAAAAALQNVLDAAESYMIEKLTGKMRDPKTGEPVKEVARISRMIFSDQFSLQDETAKSTGLTEEGFRRLKFAFKIRQIIKKTGYGNANGREEGNAQTGENETQQELIKKTTPLRQAQYGLFHSIYGLEQLSRQMEQEVSMFSSRELKKVQETLKRYLDFGKRASVDSFAAYRNFELRQEDSAEYKALDTALSAYEKANPVQQGTEETSRQKLVRGIRKAMGETNQSLNGYVRELQALMLESPEKTREMLAVRAAEAAAAKQAAEAKQTEEAKQGDAEKKALREKEVSEDKKDQAAEAEA